MPSLTLVSSPQERLLRHFCTTSTLLEFRGSLIVRRLCVLLGAERVFREAASILMEESNMEFAGVMIQALNLILLTAVEVRSAAARSVASPLACCRADLSQIAPARLVDCGAPADA